MNRRIFPGVIFVSAILISVVSEYFSIIGLSSVFAGRYAEVIILAIAIGLGKIIGVSAVFRYWKVLDKNKLGKLLKIYLIVAVGILIIITSMGVYGFLADAYQQTADKNNINESRIELLKTKKNRFQKQLIILTNESNQINQSVFNLRKSLSTDNQYQYVDRRTNQVVTSIQSTSKKGVQDQLTNALEDKDRIDRKIQAISDSIGWYEVKVIEFIANNDAGAELGPLKYISTLSGIPMDKVVNILMLILVLVIDPLAITLILISQFGFKHAKYGRKSVGSDWLLKLKDFMRSRKNNDLQQTPVSTKSNRKSRSQVKSRRSTGNRGKVSKPKIKIGSYPGDEIHFNVDIDPIADPENVLNRKVVEPNQISDQIEGNIKNKV